MTKFISRIEMLNRASTMKKKIETFLQDVSNKELKIKKKKIESFLLEVLNRTSKMKNQF